MSSKNKIYLYISDIASFIGQNHWDYVLPFERLWKRVDETGYTESLAYVKSQMERKQVELVDLERERLAVDHDLDTKKITKRQHTIAINKLSETQKKVEHLIGGMEEKIDDIDLTQQQKLEKAIGKDIVTQIQNAAVETEAKREQVVTALDTLEVSHKQLSNLKRHADSFINKTHGTIKEDTALSMYESKYKVKLDTSQQFFKTNLQTASQNSVYNWFVCGKMDGLYIDPAAPKNNYVVEIKNRTRGFFSTLRDYEKTQIQLYMLLTGFQQAQLVERYQNNLRVTQIFRDNNYINDILEYLEIFIHHFETGFLDNETAKHDFVLLDPEAKRGFLKRLYLNDINHRINQKILNSNDLDECITSDDECMIDDNSV
jgi:hypothetical protein